MYSKYIVPRAKAFGPDSSILVQKFGGSSLAGTDKIRAVAERLAAEHRAGARVVAVVSAMGGHTDELLSLARDVATAPSARELDMLLSTGERVTMALLSMAIQELGVDAVSLTGSQCRIVTDGAHTHARILEVHPDRVLRELEHGRVVIVAGFQGESQEQEITTLGRGGSDTSAVALAAALGAERCEINSDVDGVYTADPRVVPEARHIDRLSYAEMLELSRQGAKVLDRSAVSYAQKRNVTILARATFGGPASTVIQKASDGDAGRVSGVTGRGEVLRIHAQPGSAPPPVTEVLDVMEGHDVVGLAEEGALLDAVLTVQDAIARDEAAASIERAFGRRLAVDVDLGSVAAVGLGLGGRDSLAFQARRALTDAGIPTSACYTSPDALICAVPTDQVRSGVRKLHRELIDAAASHP